MPSYDFSTLDVFTDRIFGGNPLAVFPDAEGVAAEVMQAIAKELNLSETVFVLPPTSPDAVRRLRIFTPGVELPFAGHPTVGTALLLADLGVVDRDGSFVLEEGVGDVEVTLDGATRTATLTAAGTPSTQPCPAARPELAHMLALEPEDVVEAFGTPAVASAGVPFVVVGVRDLAALGRARMHAERWPAALTSLPLHVYVVTEGEGSAWRARMFAPSMEIVEDPATGAAASAFAAVLGDGAGAGTHHWTIEQGIEMGRPSRLAITAVVDADGVRLVRVGGQAVRVSDGTIRLPD